MIRSILVPLDGSSFGEQALPYALSLARRAKAAGTKAANAAPRVELMHVHTPLNEPYTEIQFYNLPLREKIREEERAYVTNLVKNLAFQAPGVSISGVFQEGPVARTIQDYVEANQFDVVVLTTHARGAFARFWLGSVADHLIRQLNVPVLAVRPGEKPMPLDWDVQLKHVLIPLDGSPFAEEILGPARDVGGLFQADFKLLRVVQHVVPAVVPLGTPGSFGQLAAYAAEEIKEGEQKSMLEAAGYLEHLAARLRGEGLHVQTEVMLGDQPARAILEHDGIDLIALETHGRRGLSRFFRGSVADKVLRGSHVPLLLHRPRQVS
jgi:nucleotide-binding universal stress UspA family protein